MERAGSVAFLTTVVLLGTIMAPDAHTATTDTRTSVQQLVLDNGLQVVWEEDHRQPLVAIEARIKGGLRGEGPYLGTGITHFIEHMLFKGTPSRPPGSIDQEVRRYGGTINAFTSYDTTGVTLFVESRYLKDALGMLADILQHAQFTQAEFDKERAVIISEIQMNLDDPDRRIHQLFWSRHFLEHPYRYPILGYQPLLEKLTVQDVGSFYAGEYQPQNITLACAGDLDTASYAALLKDVFGAWARGPPDPKQQVVPSEPPAASAKQVAIELPVQTGYVLLGFSSTRLSDPDTYPLDILANILGQGESSRLYETIIKKKQLAHSVAAWDYTPFDPGVFGIHLQTDPDKIPAAIDAVLEILEDVKRRGVTDAELQKAKRSVSAEYLFSLQTVEGRAADLASSLSATGDPLFSRRYVEGIEQVTREQVQDAATRYCVAKRMTRAIIRPQSSGPAAAAAPARRERTPVTKTVFKNGATALVGVDRTLPIAAIVVAFRGGIRVEPSGKQGVSNLVAQLLTKGTKTKGALEIAQRIESLGGSIEPFSGRDGFGLSLQLLAGDLDEGMKLIQELIAQSAFPEEELRIQRTLIEKQLQAQDDEIFIVGGRLLRRTMFSHHPYRFDPLGEKDTLPTLTRGDCVEFAKRWMVPSGMVVSVFGDVDGHRVTQQLDALFGGPGAGGSPWPSTLPEEKLDSVRTASQTVGKEQAVIMLGFLGSTHTGRDRRTLDVMTAVLSGMAGRLFQSVREQHGLSYTLGAANVPGWDPGYVMVYAATRPSEQDKVLQMIEEQLQLTRAEGFTEEEVDQAKRYLIGAHRMDLQHLVGLAKRSVLDELYGLGYDAWTTYEKEINAITVAMVNDVAKRYLTMQQRAQVIVSPNGHVQRTQ